MDLDSHELGHHSKKSPTHDNDHIVVVWPADGILMVNWTSIKIMNEFA